MSIGAFSISLNVRDIEKSKGFYEVLGFQQIHGVLEEKWIILKNGDCVVGLFQGMFEKNMLTFNPGWDQNSREVNPFKDVRVLQSELEAAGIEFLSKVEPGTEGPASFMIVDPDGNPILVDQHR